MTTIAARRFDPAVALSRICDPQLASRAEMDDQKLDELTASIAAHGLLENLILVDRGEQFEVVAGHRRTIAARRANLVTVPAWIYPPDSPSLRVIQAHENARREELHAVDEALWFAELLERDCGGDVERLAALVGEKLPHVLNRLELLELDTDTRDALRANKIKIGVARALRKIPDPHYRAYYLDAAIRGGATESMVTGWIADYHNMFSERAAVLPAPPASPSTAIANTFDPMRCEVCGNSDPRYIPKQVSIHDHCWHAVILPLLERAREGA